LKLDNPMPKTITLELPEEDLNFIQRYAKERGISVSDSIDRIISFLRRTENHPLHPDVLALAGILRGVDPDTARDEYLTRKHL
jgi:uncharacterized protein involved in type VI secretion and phage assembly